MKLVVLSGKGGVGKSMLTSALAMLFAETKRIVAVDCDADAPNLAIWLGGIKKWDRTLPVIASAKPEINQQKCDLCGLCVKNCRFESLSINNQQLTINNFLCEGCGACEVICPQKAIKLKPVQNGQIKIKKTKHGFILVSGNLFPGETGSGKVITEIKKKAEKFKHEIILIDSAPGTGCPVIAALQDANFAILITEPTPSAFSDLKRVLKVVNHFKLSWGLVINKWDINSQLSDKIEKWAGRKFLGKPSTTFPKGMVLGKISYDKKIFKAISNLIPILETNLEAKREIKRIYSNLNSYIRKNS
ncbi:ATP-binding protein [Patescibacteria group bacterium]|nr:ATP-binding protein [Patescibacteria group bacterium]